MLPLSILLLFLVGFFLFVRWDQHRIERSEADPRTRSKFARGFNPSQVVKWHGYAGVAGICAIFAAMQWLKPSAPPFTGRWSSLNTAIFAAFGTYGLAIVATVMLLAFALAAWLAWKPVRQSYSEDAL